MEDVEETEVGDMTADVIKFPGAFHADLKAEDVLRAIADEQPSHAFVITWPADGSMPSYHSTTGDTAVIVYQINRFIHKLFSGDFQ